jgi:diaminohydroxyphosphoribosylaminopyrimidine deaminase/5-amino-6-(5-phosphoribosylamino)uracil reductase
MTTECGRATAACAAAAAERHLDLMRQALALARRAEGLTRPNPPVGALVVKHGRIIGSGWHQGAGTPHAEALALSAAGAHARGATLYVTLEPCCTQGRTPPCTGAIIAAGIKTVVAAIRDPNPRHRGRGFRQLRRAGIEVIEGVGSEEARELIAPFARWISVGRPYLTLKLAMTLDGKIADYRGLSKWITSPAARREVQALRRRADAILVGAGTVRADNPNLLPRPAHGRRPWRVVVDSRGELEDHYQIFQPPGAARTIVATTRHCPENIRARRRAAGAQVWALPIAAGRVSLPTLFRRLGALGLLHVVCEGGGELAAALIRARLVDEFWFFVAPRILGGKTAIGAVGGPGWPLPSAPELVFTERRRVGRDLLIMARPA